MNSGLIGALGAAPLRVTGMTRRIVTSDVNSATNVLHLQATGGGKNVDFVLSPKGTGSFIVGPRPDGTVFGGNKTGAGSIQILLAHATDSPSRMAAGANSMIISAAPDGRSMATGNSSICIGRAGAAGQGAIAISTGNDTSSGFGSQATGTQSLAMSNGSNGVASGASSVSIGGRDYQNASGNYSVAIGGQSNDATASYAFATGFQSSANRYGQFAHANQHWASGVKGTSQYSRFVAARKTTNNTATELMLDASSSRLTIPSGTVFSCLINIVGTKSDGSAVAQFVRKACIKNVAGTTSLVNSVETIGTDSASGTGVSITADDTNDALKIEVTGIASETWRWVASIEGVEVAYGT